MYVLCFQLSFGQINNEEKLLLNYPNYETVLRYENDFNNDGIEDLLYILDSIKENNENLINNIDLSKRKSIIFLRNSNNNFIKVFESNDIFPCRECSGKSDINIDNLTFKNNLLSYTTCIAPFASNKYSILEFTLQFVNNDFRIYQYKETYFSIEEDNSQSIILSSQDFYKNNFLYYDWVADKSWLDNVIISSCNLTKINNFAFGLEKINPFVTINILQKIIQKFPDRVVAYLNLADSYWTIGNQELAKDNYIKYVELMKSQRKDLKKISKKVWTRLK